MIKRTCRLSGKEFVITEEDLEFYAKMGVITDEQLERLKSLQVDESTSVKAEKIPRDLLIGLPTLSTIERMKRRLLFRNERKLYQRLCNGTNKTIISMYSNDTPYAVYENDYWWSDKWDGLDYGNGFDFSRDFFSQFLELNKKVPKMAIIQQGENSNSKFCNCASWNKNCYLSFSANKNEDCLYGKLIFNCTDCVDCLVMNKSELCYECINSGDCYNCIFSFAIENCSDCSFCEQCVGCSNCFGCVNLIKKQYYFLNKKCTKEEYEKKLASLNLDKSSTYKNLRKNFAEFSKKFPQKFMEGFKNENCSGDIVYYSKNSQKCFDVRYLEDCKFCNDAEALKSAYDVSFYGSKGTNELLYECEGVGHGTFEVKFSKLVWGGSANINYCWECFKCSHCFGCTGLRNKQYCILNKQYSKEEYEALVPKIIEHMKQTGEWGEFFPAKLSPFAYNETVAQEYFPLTKAEAEKRGYKWKEEKQTVQYTGPKYEIPEDIADVPDEIVTKVLQCERSGKFYRIQKPELRFYRKMNLPIPRLHPDERHKDRMKLRNPRTLFERTCADCGKEIQTTFAPDRPEKVLCEECYLKIVD